MNTEAATKTFLEIKNVLDGLGIKFWLNDGTLLGAIREKGFIPWDKDIDLRISAEDQSPRICEEFIKAGFVCRPTIIYHDLISTYVVRKRRIKADIALNHYYEPADLNISLSARPTLENAVHPAKFCRGDRFVPFLGTEVRVPNPPEEALSWIYGWDWKTHVKDKSYAIFRRQVSLKSYIDYFIEKGIK